MLKAKIKSVINNETGDYEDIVVVKMSMEHAHAISEYLTDAKWTCESLEALRTIFHSDLRLCSLCHGEV